MSNLTLVHEDIYAYVDPMVRKAKTSTTGQVSYLFDTSTQNSDKGKLEVKITSGTFTGLNINMNEQRITFTDNLVAGDFLSFDFEKNFFTKNDKIVFLNDIINFSEKGTKNLSFSLIGTGVSEMTYFRLAPEETMNDLAFVQSISWDLGIERLTKTSINGKDKVGGVSKRSKTFSMSFLWYKEIENVFDVEQFQLRLVDEDGVKLDTLSGCQIDSIRKNSSDSSDFNYEVSGVFSEKL